MGLSKGIAHYLKLQKFEL